MYFWFGGRHIGFAVKEELPVMFHIAQLSRARRKHGYSLWNFAISCPRIWYSLPDYVKDSELSTDIFKRYLKTYFFTRY